MGEVRLRDKAGIALGTALLMSGVFTAIEPRTKNVQETQHQRAQQQAGDLSDAEQQERRRILDGGFESAHAENARRLVPGEYRAVRPRLWVRLP